MTVNTVTITTAREPIVDGAHAVGFTGQASVTFAVEGDDRTVFEVRRQLKELAARLTKTGG